MKKLLLLLVFVFVLSGCGRSVTKELSPSETIETFYSLANQGKSNKTLKLIKENGIWKINNQLMKVML